MSRKKAKREAKSKAEDEPKDDAESEAVDHPTSRGDEEPSGPGTDVSQIDASELEERAFPEALPSEYRVTISEAAFEVIKAHAQSDTSIELCGVLAGSLLKDEDGPYLMVEKAIEGVATRRTGSQVTFTQETWERIHKQMEEDCPDLRIVGWYHTHPGFGIFLSEMDQFIQDNFFNLPHQVAFVYDPVAERRGLYIWQEGKSSRLRRYWLGGELVYDEEGAPAPEPPRPERKPREDEEDFDRRPPRPVYQPPEPEPPSLRWSAAWFVVALVGLFAAYWMGSHSARVAAESTSKQAKEFEALIRTGLFRDNLGFELNAVLGRLNDVHNQLQAVQGKLGKDADAQTAEELKESIEGVLAAHRDLGEIGQAYTKTKLLADRMERVARLPDEMALLAVQHDAQRALLSSMCVLQARVLLDQPEDAQTPRRVHHARQYRELAVAFAPKLEDAINRELPELAPKKKKEEPPPAEGKKENE